MGATQLIAKIEARRNGQNVNRCISFARVSKILGRNVIHLPPYCPHFNPIERLWAVMHQYVTHNRHYPTQKQFADEALRIFRETLPNEWKNFRDQVSDNFSVVNHDKFWVLR